jgi:peptidyl-prolyl cis-trans isomerase SDCCAG10
MFNILFKIRVQEVQEVEVKENNLKKKGSKLDVKNAQLLSFEEDDNNANNIKIKSSHDVLKQDLRLSKRTYSDSEEDSDQEQVRETLESRKKMRELLPSEKRLESLKDQVSLMKAELRGKLKPKEEKVQKVVKHVSLVDQIRNDYLKSGKVTVGKSKKKSDKSFHQMQTFKNILHEKTGTAALKEKPEKKDLGECKLHLIKNCASCFDQFGVLDNDDDDDDDWMNTSLVFKKEVGANVYQPKPDDYTVIDPRVDVTKSVDIFGKNAPSEKRAWSERAIKSNRKESQSASYPSIKK